MDGHDSCDGLCLFIEEQTDLNTFESILKKYSHLPISVILKYRDFDFLMLCLKYKVTKVFEGKLNEKSLENYLIHVDLSSRKETTSLPVNEIIELFSKPAKIKNNQELDFRLQGYFSSFVGFKAFEVFNLSASDTLEKSTFSLINNIEIMKELVKEKIPKKYIGHKVEMRSTEDLCLVASPVFVQDDEASWLIVELEKKTAEIVLNELFFKFLENVLIYRVNKLKEQNLQVLATTDEITGLYNQRKLSEDLESTIAKHEEEDETFSIMFIDVDHFKSVNDNYGHVVGSKLLQEIGDVLSLILRASDHIYRYGGDEFVVIMPTVDIETVHEIGARVLSKIKNKVFRINDNETYKLSVSIGIAEYPTDAKSAVEIIRFADEMMYMSKRSGRGKVFHVKEVEDVDASSE
jgi:diguanylate cyclase (GGDEF)-like protein